MAIVDAGLYVALVHEGEAGHSDSWAWLHAAQARREALRAPAILAAEVAAAISRGTASPELAHQIVVQLMTSNVVELVAISTHLAGRAAVIAAEHRLKGCDAVYVALAERMGDILLTLNHEQLERGSALVATMKPGKQGDTGEPN